MGKRTYFKFVCLGCNQEFSRRTDKRQQSNYCRPCRGRKTLQKHGDSFSRLYGIWAGMRRRCDSNNPNYGGSGVRYCPEWSDYEAFKKWAINNGYEETLSIDRINPFGDYEPSNCRWIAFDEQARNKRVGLSWEAVKAIRKLAPDFTYQFIADKFLVSKATVGLVARNKIWHDPTYIPSLRPRHQKILLPTHHPKI